MKDKFDEKISKILNENIYISQRVTYKLRNCLKEENKGEWAGIKWSKMLATMALVMIVGTGVVFAGKTWVNHRFASVLEASDHGYFEPVSGDFIKHNGLGIKVTEYFVDTTRVGLTFYIQADHEIDEVRMYNTEEKTNNFAASDVIRFIDETGNEIPYKGNEVGVHSAADFDYNTEQLENNIFKMSYLQFPNEDYRKARKMKIVIKRVVTKKDGKEKEYIGNWEFEIDIADKYRQKSDRVLYHATVGGVVVGNAELSGTEMVVKINDRQANEAQEASKKEAVSPSKRNEDEIIIPKLLGEDRKEIENVFSGGTFGDNDGTEIRFNISNYNQQNSYQIVLESGMIITLNKEK